MARNQRSPQSAAASGESKACYRLCSFVGVLLGPPVAPLCKRCPFPANRKLRLLVKYVTAADEGGKAAVDMMPR